MLSGKICLYDKIIILLLRKLKKDVVKNNKSELESFPSKLLKNLS